MKLICNALEAMDVFIKDQDQQVLFSTGEQIKLNAEEFFCKLFQNKIAVKISILCQ